MVTYQGVKYPSILQLAKALGVPDAALARYRRNATTQEEFETLVVNHLKKRKTTQLVLTGYNNKYETTFKKTSEVQKHIEENHRVSKHYTGKTSGITQLEYIELFLLLWDTEYRWVLDRELSFTYNNETYKDFNEFSHQYGIYLADISKGMLEYNGDMRKTLLKYATDKYRKIHRPVVKGVQYNSVSELCTNLKIDSIIYRWYIKNGYTDDEAYEHTTAAQRTNTEYFPLKTNNHQFYTVQDLEQYLGLPVVKVERLLKEGRIEHFITLREKGVVLENYVDRETGAVFPITHKGTVLTNVKQFLDYFDLDGREKKIDYYSGIFDSKEETDKLIKRIEDESIVFEDKVFYSLKTFRRYLKMHYRLNSYVIQDIWKELIPKQLTPEQRGAEVSRRLSELRLKTTYFNIGDKTAQSIKELCAYYKVSSSNNTIARYIQESTTQQEFIKKVQALQKK